MKGLVDGLIDYDERVTSSKKTFFNSRLECKSYTVFMTKMAEKPCIPFKATCTYIAHIREYLPGMCVCVSERKPRHVIKSIEPYHSLG